MVTATTADFGTVLKRLRKERGLSQEAVAERAAVSTQAISALERGFRKSPHPATIQSLADALQLNAGDRAELLGAAAANRADRYAAAQASERDPGFGRLPSPLTTVVGRTAEIGAIDALLRTQRFVTVVGPGGIGKTTVALAAARGAQGRYADGVYFCDLSPLRNGELVASAIASARGVTLLHGRDPVALLAVAFGSSCALLVLDNCEHLVLETAALTSALLRACPGITVLATSRRRVGPTGEVLYRLRSLPTLSAADERHLTAAQAGLTASVALFVQRATAVNPEFLLSDANARDVARVCRRLDGIPLAIELAAAQIRLMSAGEIERHLVQRFRLLGDDRGKGHPRHRTLLATFDESYELLDARERRFFRALGIFAGTFSLDAALEICCDAGANELQALELLATLVDASLVVVDPGTDLTRYHLLETTRAYAAEAMEQHEERGVFAARHLAYYRKHADTLDFIVELENLRGALQFALEGGDQRAGAELLGTIGGRWSYLGLNAEGIAHLETFLPLVPPDDAALAALLRINLSMLRFEMLRYRPAFEEARLAVDLARSAGNDGLLFWALRVYTMSASILGALDVADAALEEAAEVAARAPSEKIRILLLYTQGRNFLGRHLLEKAVAAFREAYRLARAIDDPYLEVYTAGSVAEAEHEAGRTAEAAAVVTACRAESRLQHIQDGAGLANLVGYRIALADDAGASAAARELFALRDVRPIMHVYTTLALEHLALAHVRTGHAERGARLAGYCEARYRDFEYERAYTERLTNERLSALLAECFAEDKLASLLAEGALLTEDAALREAVDDAPLTVPAAHNP